MTDKLHKIEWVEPDGVKIGKTVKLPGTTDFVTAAERDMYVNAGWAKCCKTGECGERKPGSVRVKIDSTKQVLSTE